jgi:sterol 3beta-glucosyltransferase
MRKSGPIQRRLVADGWAVAEAARPDAIVFHPKLSASAHYAEKLGVPAVLAALFPLFLPTGAFPNPGLPVLGHGRLAQTYNRTTHRLVMRLATLFERRFFRPWRAEHGLPDAPIRTAHRTDGRRISILNAWSPHVAPPPPDWPADAHPTGYWFLDREDRWTPPDSLARFLNDGPPPAYVGFGSMAGRRPEQTTRTVLEALARTGMRGVLARGWGGLSPTDVPHTVHLIDAVPHDWLFPRVAAVVHHGGAGSTAAGLRAGRPTVVCPFFGDQPFWGRRVQELGVGPAPMSQRTLTPEKLATALREATSAAVQAKAERLGAAIRAEDGVGRAVTRLESVVRPSGTA